MVVGRPKVSAAALAPRHGIVAISGRWPGHPWRASCCARRGLRRTSTGHKGQLATLLLIELHQSDVFGSACDYPLSLEERKAKRWLTE
jgi:hypothetical protein